MAASRLATALWIHTRTPIEQIRSALQRLPLVSEVAGGGFVHVLYDTERWDEDDGICDVLPARMVRDRLLRAQIAFVPAIGRETYPSAATG